MSAVEQIKTGTERTVRAVTRRPSVGQGTQVMHCETTPSGCCTVRDGEASLTIDLSEEFGGDATTLSPGFLTRAALSACLAQGYLVRAAEMEVPINQVTVELQCDFDLRGVLGLDTGVAPSYTGVRYIVNVESPAPEHQVMAVIDRSDALDWVRDVFTRAIALEREVRITGTESGA